MSINLEESTHYANVVLVIFTLGYLAIIIEDIIKLNKTATALLMAVGCWTVLFFEPEESAAGCVA